MLETLFGSSAAAADISLATVLLAIGVSVAIGILISVTYMKTSGRRGHSRNFAQTLVLTPAVVAAIILLIGSNIARAFSLAGAFAIIRFRSVPGDPKDTAYVLFTMATGLASGAGYFGYAVLFAVLLCAVMFLLHVTGFGARKTSARVLKITVPEDLDYEGAFDEVLARYTTGWELRKVKTADLGSVAELVYAVKMDERTNRKEFVDALRCRNGNLNIALSMGEETIE